MNLRDTETPAPKLADQIVERVLMLGEEEKLHPGVAEDPLGGKSVPELEELGLHFALFQRPGLVNERGQLPDVFFQRNRVNRSDHALEGIEDALLLVFWQVLEIIG